MLSCFAAALRVLEWCTECAECADSLIGCFCDGCCLTEAAIIGRRWCFWQLLKHANEQLLATDGVTVTYMARRNPFKTVSTDATLADVVDVLSSTSATRVRRVAVLDADKKLVNIISTSRCVAFLADHLEKLGDYAKKTVRC